MDFISSPWEEKFFDFVRSITRSAILVSPYITSEPLAQLARRVSRINSIQIKILTKLDSASMLHGSLDVNAVSNFCSNFPETKVSHLPGLHAKIYIADDHTAIITSGNLTQSSLSRNLEYGIRLQDQQNVSEIYRNLQEYEKFGVELTVQQLKQFTNISQRLTQSYRSVLNSTNGDSEAEFERQFQVACDSIRELRGGAGESITSIFKRSVRFVLREGPLPTKKIHKRIQCLHPDLCDDSEDRVINGVYFGKLWKHHVRNAQQSLKREKQIQLVNGEWNLIR